MIVSFAKTRSTTTAKTAAAENADAAVLDRVAATLGGDRQPTIPESAAAPQLAAVAPPKRPQLADAIKATWHDWAPLRRFALATLAPTPLLAVAAFAGGFWAVLSFLAMTVLVFALDKFLILPDAAPLRAEDMQRAERLSVILAGVHLVLLLVGILALSGGTGLGAFPWLAVYFSFGLWFGQVSNANAHELIHRSDKRLFVLGQWVFISLLFGHHTSAHRLVHHRYFATTEDPNTAAAGESFYAFAPRAWWESLLAGYEMESEMRKGRNTERLFDLHPYAVYIGGAMGCVIVTVMLFGGFGLLAYLALAAYAQLQLHLSDYVQHYGILRQKRADGSLEPGGPAHSWNAPHPVSALMMLNAPLHSDHHCHPARPYPTLEIPAKGTAPMLPYSLPVMGVIALIPPLWFRVMDARLTALRPDRWSKPIT